MSTAYYALFHLLTEDAAGRWDGSAEARSGVERRGACVSAWGDEERLIEVQCTDVAGLAWRSQPIPEEVRRVASAFAELQEARHIADYDNHEQWTLSEALTLLNSAATAFQDWEAIRTHPLAMLVQRQR